MSKNMMDRLSLLMARYDELNGTEFLNEVNKEQAIRTVKGLGFFSIPMLEEILSAAKAEKEDILTNDVISLLAEYGITEATMLDGTVVGKDVFYEVSQSGKDKELLASWLTANGYGSTIKDTLSFDKGSFKDEIVTMLQAKGYSFSRDSSVHPQTLKKTIKDHVLSGGQLPPEEACRVSIFERGVVKPPKEKKDF
jgi:hypothetical protein